MNLTEKASYINGLVEGLEMDSTTKEGKVIAALLDLVNDLSNAVSDLSGDVEQIYDELEAIDDDLTDVEDYLFEEDEDDEDEYDDDELCDCDDDEYDDEDDEDAVYEITCPNCGKSVLANEKMLMGENLCCPKCGVSWEVEFGYEDEESEEENEEN